MKINLDSKKTKLLLFWGAVLLLFLSFNFNFFKSVNPIKFYTFQSDSEGLIIGRLVKSKLEGILSSQARLGRYYEIDGDENSNQKKLYSGEIKGGEYGEYNSQFGLQGIIFSQIDIFLSNYDIKAENKIKIFHALMSLLLALVIISIISILYSDIGFEASLILFTSILLSKWPVYMAKNLYWMLVFMFIPFFIVMASCALEEKGKKIYFSIVFVMVTISVLLKSLMGYEYITTVLIATVTPLIYYSIKNNWPRKLLISRFILLTIFSLFGFIIALILHAYQLEFETGGINEAVNSIKERVLARTQTSPEAYINTPYYDSQKSSVFYVLYVFLIKGGSFRLKIPYIFWILVTAYISFNVYKLKISDYDKNNNLRLLRALVITTWFSLLAPLSWFILAKSHSYIHNINYIVWHIPFMIFVFALIGFYWRLKIRYWLEKYRRKLDI